MRNPGCKYCDYLQEPAAGKINKSRISQLSFSVRHPNLQLFYPVENFQKPRALSLLENILQGFS